LGLEGENVNLGVSLLRCTTRRLAHESDEEWIFFYLINAWIDHVLNWLYTLLILLCFAIFCLINNSENLVFDVCLFVFVKCYRNRNNIRIHKHDSFITQPYVNILGSRTFHLGSHQQQQHVHTHLQIKTTIWIILYCWFISF